MPSSGVRNSPVVPRLDRGTHQEERDSVQPVGPPIKSGNDTKGKEVPETGISGPVQPPGEVNGPRGPEPTRFGDWEKGGRCTDF